MGGDRTDRYIHTSGTAVDCVRVLTSPSRQPQHQQPLPRATDGANGADSFTPTSPWYVQRRVRTRGPQTRTVSVTSTLGMRHCQSPSLHHVHNKKLHDCGMPLTHQHAHAHAHTHSSSQFLTQRALLNRCYVDSTCTTRTSSL
jgi:hypothetical protein